MPVRPSRHAVFWQTFVLVATCFGAHAGLAQSDVVFSGDGMTVPGGSYIIDRVHPFEFTAYHPPDVLSRPVSWSVSAHASPAVSTPDPYFQFQEFEDAQEVASSYSGFYDPEIITSHPYRLIDFQMAGAAGHGFG